MISASFCSSSYGQAPVLTASTNNLNSQVGVAITPITATNTGGAVGKFPVIGPFATPNLSVIPLNWSNPLDVAVDAAGNVYFAEQDQIWKVTPAGAQSVFVGGGGGRHDGTAGGAAFDHVSGIAIDGFGNMYIADQLNNQVRKVVMATQVVTTYAGDLGGAPGFNNANGNSATFSNPVGVAVDAAGNVYVADYNNHAIRKIATNRDVTTIAGTGAAGNSDNLTNPTLASFNHPMGVAVDAAGNIYVGDRGNNKIRLITTAGAVTTFAGSGTAAFANGTGTAASFNAPDHMCFDPAGNLYVADEGNQMIRKITPTQQVSTFAGSGGAGLVDGSFGAFNHPWGVAINSAGDFYVADDLNNRIRKLTMTPNWKISPQLSPGLSFLNGTISGTPTYASPPTTYRITATNDSGAGSADVTIGIYADAPSTVEAQNSVITYVPRSPIYDITQFSGKSVDDLNKSTKYIDGIGRPLQTVDYQASPQKRDVVQPVVYDVGGRESIKYKPYTLTQSAVSDGSFKSTALADQAAFYNPTSPGAPYITGTPFPYAQAKYEPTPLNRVAEQGFPGDNWQPAATVGASNPGHTVKTIYHTNNASTSTPYWARLYTVSLSGSTPTLVNSGTYDLDQLFVTITSDENGSSGKLGTVEEYKDVLGRVILKRTFVQNGTNTDVLSTYYVYDELGNLSFVLPPGADPDNGSINSTTLDNFCYQYQYDSKSRLAKKKMPGKGWEYLVYNNNDLIVATQDQMQRGKTPQEWSFTKYDAAGRLAYSGIYQYPGSTAGVDYQSTLQSTLDNETVHWETRTTGGSGYTTVAWPQANITRYLVLNYYDNYVFPNNPYIPAISGTNTSPTGLLTASKTSVLLPDGTYGAMLWESNYYDDKSRIIDKFKQHYLGGEAAANPLNYDEIAFTYNFAGEVTQTTRHHIKVVSGTPTLALTLQNSYNYDHTGRKTQNWVSFVSGTGSLPAPTLLSQLTYNELGQLYRKQLNANDAATTANITLGAADAFSTGEKDYTASQSITLTDGFYASNGTIFTAKIKAPLQDISYVYNERGWLTQSTSQYLSYQLHYNDGISPQYNGNISQMSYNVSYPSQATHVFNYTYDALDRLTNSESSGVNLNEALTYDDAGNISSLTRNGTVSNYSYTGNQLNSVSGGISRTYAYDGNGNAQGDGSGNSISYNLLNLPKSVTNSSAATLATYTYDVGGQKLRATGVSGGNWDYANGIIYDGSGNLKYVLTDEGRIVNNSETFRYVYDLKDHLGNVRASIDKDGNGNAELLQEDEYYAFGTRQGTFDASNGNTYLYNGKEIQPDLNNQYDYGARFYDPVIARWNVVDPLSEINRSWSPYRYGFDNPMRYIDPDGMEEKEDGSKLYDPGDWFVSDRLNNTARWQSANLYNLENGNSDQYNTIEQRDQFYGWFQQQIEAQGQETLWAGAAYTVAKNVSEVDNPINSLFISNDVINFSHDGNRSIFNDIFDRLTSLYDNGKKGIILKGKAANDWDRETTYREQFQIMGPVYARQSSSTIEELSKLAKGEGIYGLGYFMQEQLKFQGNINNPQDRFNFGMNIVVPYYKAFGFGHPSAVRFPH
jgi:RHS repeat-associated protein